MTTAGTRPLSIGLVGCGRIADTHLNAIRDVAECEIGGVADIDSQLAGRVAREHNCDAFNDYQSLATSDGLDAVIICTPPNVHAEIASFFLDQGVHVLCEKPLAISQTDSNMLARRAEVNGRILMMASKFRYVDDVIKAKGILDSGILGRIILYENVFCSKVDMQGRWNADKAIGGGGVLIDNGTHSVDIARYLLGPIVEVQAEQGPSVQRLEVEDTCRLYFRTADKAMGAVDLSWSLHKERDAYIEVFGSEGMLSIGWQGSRYRQSEKMDWIEFGNGYDKQSAFRSQLKNFAGAIAGTETPLIDLHDGLESVRVIEAAYRSLENDKWVRIAERG